MPVYRVHAPNGAVLEVTAARVVSDGDSVCFENWASGAWRSVVMVLDRDVVGLQRRIRELDGNWGWIGARPEATGDHQHRIR